MRYITIILMSLFLPITISAIFLFVQIEGAKKQKSLNPSHFVMRYPKIYLRISLIFLCVTSFLTVWMVVDGFERGWIFDRYFTLLLPLLLNVIALSGIISSLVKTVTVDNETIFIRNVFSKKYITFAEITTVLLKPKSKYSNLKLLNLYVDKKRVASIECSMIGSYLLEKKIREYGIEVSN